MRDPKPNRREALQRLSLVDATLQALGVAQGVVVIGGTALATFDFGPETPDARPTEDVDLVVPGGRLEHGSQDLEDLVMVLDGDPSARDAIARESTSMSRYIRYELHERLKQRPNGLELIQGSLPGDIASQLRADWLWDWLAKLPAP